MDHTAKIREFYSNAKLEWDRLEKGFAHEKYITLRMMDRFMPSSGRLLGIGGGPGHYSLYYAKKGLDVTLLDLSVENLRFAESKAAEQGVRLTACLGNALELSAFSDGEFDAVFLMGPLYHLLEEAERRRALNEAVRVLKSGGILVCSFILSFAQVIYAMRERPSTILEEGSKAWMSAAAKGESISFAPFDFTFAYETTVQDACALIASNSALKLRSMFSQEGILAPYCARLAQMPEQQRLAWYEYSLGFCDKPEYLSHAEHLAVIAEKL